MVTTHQQRAIAEEMTTKMRTKRTMKHLPEAFHENETPIYVTSFGDLWTGVYNKKENTFIVNGKNYGSPTALCREHSNRITTNHPIPTNPGFGWENVFIVSSDISIAKYYDTYHRR